MIDGYHAIYQFTDSDGFGEEIARLFFRYSAYLFGILDHCVEGRGEAYVSAILRSDRVSFIVLLCCDLLSRFNYLIVLFEYMWW